MSIYTQEAETSLGSYPFGGDAPQGFIYADSGVTDFEQRAFEGYGAHLRERVSEAGSVVLESIFSNESSHGHMSYVEEDLAFATTALDAIRLRLANQDRAYAYHMSVLTPLGTDPDLNEKKLNDEFIDLAEELEAMDHMSPIAGQEIREAGAFSFVPVVVLDAHGGNNQRSVFVFGQGDPTDLDSYTRHGGNPGEKPWLDARFAIGLEFHRLVIAVAAAGVDYDGNLLIRQIQNVSGMNRGRGRADHERFMNSGLCHGFRWRDTLVSGWEEIARRIGCPAVVIQTYAKNGWDSVREHGKAGYDGVADRMGYRQMSNMNWIKYL